MFSAFTSIASAIASKKVEATSESSAVDEFLLKAPLDTFRVLIVLDASGSMSDIRDDMVGSINQFIAQQKQIAEETKEPTLFTLMKFNDKINFVQFDQNLANAQPLTKEEYITDRRTALYDAIGTMISKFKECTRVACVIVTDGENNASETYEHKDIVKMISEQSKWEFIYMSQNIDGFKQGASIGISKNNNIVVEKSSFEKLIVNSISSSVAKTKMLKTSASQ